MSNSVLSGIHIPDESITVVGAGAWGTTLAGMLATAGIATTLVPHSAEHASQLRSSRENTLYLPGFAIPESISITHELEQAVTRATIVMVVVPTKQVRSVGQQIRSFLRTDAIIISCAKGFEEASLTRMTEVIADATGIEYDRVCALSGPNLARELAAGMPASTVVASTSEDSARRAQRVLTSPAFRVYTSPDVIGVEYGGALKNVVALAAGAVDGMEAGKNAKAALIARGLAEMTRLGAAAGASPMTFSGLSGLGDLIATCESPLSRNRTFGERLGRGVAVEDAAGESPHVVEGVAATRSAVSLAKRFEVEMPIAAAVLEVLNGRSNVRDAVTRLMTREARPEPDDGIAG